MPISEEAKKLQVFADGLRAALGLCPLYGADVSFGGVETITDPLGHSRGDDWFQAAATYDDTTRDDRRTATIKQAERRKARSRIDL